MQKVDKQETYTTYICKICKCTREVYSIEVCRRITYTCGHKGILYEKVRRKCRIKLFPFMFRFQENRV